MKKIENAYEKLLKIKRPVMIFVLGAPRKGAEFIHDRSFRDRIRILYPDGRLLWCDLHRDMYYGGPFGGSCCQGINLCHTLQLMEDYDAEHTQIIVDIQEL